MSTSIIPFSYADHPVRVIQINGEPWFVAADVAAVLGYRDAAAFTRGLDDSEDRGTRIVCTPSGAQEMTVISEAGLYACLLRSRTERTKTFRRWVTHEVLPAIRRRGGYLTPEAAEQVLTDPDFIIRLATELKTERAKRAQLEARAAADAPKVLFADAVAASNSTILIGDLAKLLRQNGIAIGGTRLFACLRNDGYLIGRRGTDWNSPTQYAMELGLFTVKETAITHSDGHVSISKTTKVTGRGQQYFIERFLDGRLPKTTTEEVAS